MMVQAQVTHAQALTALAQAASFTAVPFTLTGVPGWAPPGGGREGLKRGMRFARTVACHPLVTTRTCVRAAKLLPTVRAAIPVWVWPILAVATVVKCLPVDFGADETLFALAFALIAWRRPGLLPALYREAQAGKPVACQCGTHRK